MEIEKEDFKFKNDMILFKAESIAVAAGFKFFEETLANGATYKGQFSHFLLQFSIGYKNSNG